MLKNAAILTSIYTLLFGAIAYSAYNDTSTQNKTNLKVLGNTAQMPTVAAQPKEDGSSNAKIVSTAQDLIQKKYNNHNINVRIFQGTMVLRGYVANDQMKENIERDVRKIQGVKNVTNLLEIRSAKVF